MTAVRADSTAQLLGQTVRRIWEEKGGLKGFTEEKLIEELAVREREAQGPAVAAGAPADVAMEDDEVDAAEKPPSELSKEQMAQLKMDVGDRLG